ncbi:MAG TPA: hypothetical protein VK524_12685 [Polyangiaceae bacterium]|nr:hypothetical protein [Polyangiaceae bacterium]
MRARLSSMLIAAAATMTLALSSPSARAIGKEEASPDGKGIVGGALLGGETVMLLEAAFKVRQPWAYVVGGIAGGIAGGVGGYFAEQETDSARVPMFLLAGGLVLAIPTTVAVLSTTSYKPPANYVQDRPPADEPIAEPPQPGSAPPPASPTTRNGKQRAPSARKAVAAARLSAYQPVPRLLTPPSLVGFDQGLLSLSLPAVEVRSVYTKRDVQQMGVKQETEVRIPVFNFSF